MTFMPIQINKTLISEIIVRLFLWMSFIWFDHSAPFIREIRPEELWLYQYPVQKSYVPTSQLWLIVFGIPLLIFFMHYYTTKDRNELTRALLCLTLNFGLNGFLTCFLKVVVGRPRPCFFYRCFPDGKGRDLKNCTGDAASAMDGRKSFPSGHSSFAFASMVFVTLYLVRRLRVFEPANKGNSLRFITALSPILVAVSIAVSRTCDYHHHWQDVISGSILGTSVAYITYKLHYPNEEPPTALDMSFSTSHVAH